jgi:predicted Rossmann fold nucleotide-binding protein DprA/Smf involved in DNA uptake
VSKLTKKLTKSGAKLSETLQNNLITLEKSLVNTSETIDILADDTERLKDSASPFLKTRVEKTIDAVKQTLQESDRAWQELISSATTELEKTNTPK